MQKLDDTMPKDELTLDGILSIIREAAAIASVEVLDAITQFVLKAHDSNRPEVPDLPSRAWIVLKEIMHPNKYVDIGAQRFYRGFVIIAGRGTHLYQMTREEEDDFLAREDVACFLPIINNKIYDIVHGMPLIRSIPKPPVSRAEVPFGAIRISIESENLHWSDNHTASALVMQAFVQAGYRTVQHRSDQFPSKSFTETMGNPFEIIRRLEDSDRQARQAGNLASALRSRQIIIDELPNLDENGEPKTVLNYRNGRQVGYASGPYWDRQPKES